MIHIGDCLETMRGMEAGSFDAIVTDPPYGIGFMGKAWDGKDIEARLEKRRSFDSHDPNAWSDCGGHKSAAAAAGRYDLSPKGMRAFQEFSREWGVEALRVAKPGAYCVAFASPRTFHRLVCGMEEAGWEIRDTLMWVFGSGFPKSHNGEWGGTALKPAWEPIILARKPLAGTVAANWAQHGTGALNIDGCRIEAPDGVPLFSSRAEANGKTMGDGLNGSNRTGEVGLGRWPANLVHDGSDDVLSAFPSAPGQQGDLKETGRARPSSGRFGDMAAPHAHAARVESDTSAARFFYCAKASKSDRGAENAHPTVKPTELMRYLCRLVTPPGGLILDPFAGSGSTGRGAVAEGFRFQGIELDPAYAAIAEARIRAVQPGLSFGEVA